MITMDFKGITWVGHAYQKFESMCLEVEEIMYQDTVKYVEDQVQTVGASVKKFYSDVMQDVMQDLLLPSSFEPVKAAAVSDTPVEKYAGTLIKPNVDLEAGIKGESEQLSEDSEVIADLNENAVHVASQCKLRTVDNIFESCPASLMERASSGLLSGDHDNKSTLDKSNVENLPLDQTFSEAVHVESELSRMSSFSENANANSEVSCQEIPTTLTKVSVEEDDCDSREASFNEMKSASESVHKTLNDDLQLIESIGKKDKEMRYPSSTNGSAEPNGSSSDAGMVTLIGCSMNGDIRHNEFSEKIAFSSNPGQSNEWAMDTSGSTSGTVGGKETKTVQALDKTGGVDESCIMVNGPELHFHRQREGKHKPYQKKIRDAISSRMRSTRKKEYKQLALWYGDDAKSDQDCEKSSVSAQMTEDTKRTQAHDVLDSEWELL